MNNLIFCSECMFCEYLNSLIVSWSYGLPVLTCWKRMYYSACLDYIFFFGTSPEPLLCLLFMDQSLFFVIYVWIRLQLLEGRCPNSLPSSALCVLFPPLFLFLSRRINLFQASSMGTLNNFHVYYKLLGHLAVIPSLSQQV